MTDPNGDSVIIALACDAIDILSVSDACISSVVSDRAVVTLVATASPSIGRGKFPLQTSYVLVLLTAVALQTTRYYNSLY